MKYKLILKLGILISLLGVAFFSGYTYSKNTSYRSIVIGQPSEVIEEQTTIIFETNDKSESDFLIVNNFIKILMGECLQDASVEIDQKSPDLFIWLNSNTPTNKYSLFSLKVWFTSEGAIIGSSIGDNWDDVSFKKITKEQAEYIKDFLK